MNTTFEKFSDAVAVGYQRPGQAGRVLEHYRGYDIIITDTSGPNWFGYEFGVRAVPDDASIREGRTGLGPFGSTVTVWGRQEKNQLGQLGAFTVMFAPGALDAAIREARTAIDAAPA